MANALTAKNSKKEPDCEDAYKFKRRYLIKLINYHSHGIGIKKPAEAGFINIR